MRALSATELLNIWERAISEPLAQRALVLLEATCEEIRPEELRHLSIGRRDERLLTLRELTFGSRLQGLAGCPQCGEQLETDLDVSDLRVSQASEFSQELDLESAGHKLHFRPINSADLACLSTSDETDANKLHLVKRCLISATYEGREIAADGVPDQLVSLMAEKIVQADPQADVQLALSCPACRHSWHGSFDIVSFFWIEIHSWATRILREVHTLAGAYGWSEKDILLLSPQRRRAYLELVGV